MSITPLTKISNKKRYFTQDTEDAIIQYNLTDDFSLRSKIYENKIHYAFYKLTENIIHTFKFHHTDVEDIEDLQHELMIFLLSKIHRFNPENGAKAYSYFGTIVKRWLINYNKKNYKKKIVKTPLEELDNSTDDVSNSNIHADTSPKDNLYNFVELYTEYCSENLDNLFDELEEKQIADAILELFRKRDHLIIFNKKALYIYIREIVDVKTSKITKIASILSNIFKKSYTNYLETGIIKF